MEVMSAPNIGEKECCLNMINEADFDAFANKIQLNVNEAKFYYDVEKGKETGTLAVTLNAIKKQMNIPLKKHTSRPKQPAISWEVKRMLELQHQLPELSAFRMHRKIGSGTFSVVYLASLKANPRRLFALKHLIPTTLPHRIEQELKCLRDIGGHDNVVGVDICLKKDDCIVIVMPYINQVRIHDFVKDIGVAETREYMRGLLVALRRVHSFNIIHRDVKPSNFLYDRENKKYLLIDFGLASKAYLPPEDLKPALENKLKRKREDDLCPMESSSLVNPPKRMALHTIQNENGITRSPVMSVHSVQKPSQLENCPPTETGNVDVRVNEVKKRLFFNESTVLNTCLEQSTMAVNQKSPVLRPKKMNRANIMKSQAANCRAHCGTPVKDEEGVQKEVDEQQLNDITAVNKCEDFVAPKKISDLVRKSIMTEENGRVAPMVKARKMLMPYQNKSRNPKSIGLGSRFQLNKDLIRLQSKNSDKLMASKGKEDSVLSTKCSKEPSYRHSTLMAPKARSKLMAPKGLESNDGSNAHLLLDTRNLVNTPTESDNLIACNLGGRDVEPTKAKTPLMAPKENYQCLKRRPLQGQNTVSQTPGVSGLQQFQTLTSCEKGATSLRVQNSQVKEVRKETFVSPPNLTTAGCSCFGKGRVCNLCLKRKTMIASRAGTPGFRPPEVLLKYSNQTTAVDMWAAGVMMLSLVSGCYPFFRSPTDIAALTELTTLFGSKKFQEVAKKLGRHVTVSQVKKPLNLRKLCKALRQRSDSPRPTEGAETCFDCRQIIDKMQGCMCETDEDALNPSPLEQSDGVFPPSAYDLLTRLMDLDPETRITAAEALEHPFLKGE